MTVLTRRSALLGAGSATLLGSIAMPFVARAQNAQFAYKYANNLQLSHPLNILSLIHI